MRRALNFAMVVFASLSVAQLGSASPSMGVADIQKRDQALGVRSLGYFKASAATDLMAVFNVGDIAIENGEAVYLEVPAHLRAGTVDFISLTHRQSPKEEGECRWQSETDCRPGYTSLEIFDANAGSAREAWRHWAGHGSGPYHSKFAEIRAGRGETDNLYEWQRLGHDSVESGSHSTQPIAPLLLRVRSVGPDRIRLQQVILKIAPPQPGARSTAIFSRGFEFGDFFTARGRRYPGNASMGDYGHSLSLDRFSTPKHSHIPSDWSVERGKILIHLKPGSSLRALDIACGDMRPVPSGANPDEYRGGAYLTVKRVRHGQVLEVLMDGENVGTNGVMRALPSKLDQKAGEGEALEISAPAGRVQIMGVMLSEDHP